MGYVPGYDYDIFISYATVDNEPIPSADRGWVDILVQILTSGSGLAGKLGRREYLTWWLDKQKLRGNHEIGSHIPEQVKRSAVLLVILSPGYVASKFCRIELDTFIESLNGVAGGRVFVVYREPLVEKRHTLPEPLKGLRMYEFYELDDKRKPRVLGWPLPDHRNPSDRVYFQRIDDVCQELADELDELRSAAAAEPRTPAPAPRAHASDPPAPAAAGKRRKGAGQVVVNERPLVLLAETTDDLVRKHDEARRYLEQAGIGVLPSGTYYGLSSADYQQALRADLGKSAAFVQILGPELGRSVDGVADGFGWLQYNVAKDAQVPILQWRSLELGDLRVVRDPKQRRLLQNAEAMPFEDFKRKIVQDLSAERGKPARQSFFFINCASVDVKEADAIGSNLLARVDWERPAYEDKPKARTLQEAIESSLIDCDGLLILHDKSPAGWVRAQLQLYRKLRQRRASDPRVMAVVQFGAAPELKGVGLAGVKIIGVGDLSDVIGATIG
jgi:hypothetical protein